MESFSGKPFPQNAVEIETLAQIMVAAKCSSFLEIGSRFGDSFHYLATRGLVVGPGRRAVAVDMPGGPWGRENSEPMLRKVEKALNGEPGLHASLVLGDSRDPQVIAEVGARGPFDAVFIDGDHSTEGVLADWQNYSPFARKLVAFHDIVADQRAGKRGRKFGVGALWRTLKAKRSHIEIVGKDSPMGIGVILL